MLAQAIIGVPVVYGGRYTNTYDEEIASIILWNINCKIYYLLSLVPVLGFMGKYAIFIETAIFRN